MYKCDRMVEEVRHEDPVDDSTAEQSYQREYHAENLRPPTDVMSTYIGKIYVFTCLQTYQTNTQLLYFQTSVWTLIKICLA